MNNYFLKFNIIFIIFIIIYIYNNKIEHFKNNCPNISENESPCISYSKKCKNNKYELEHIHSHIHIPSPSDFTDIDKHNIKIHNKNINNKFLKKHIHKHKHIRKCEELKGCVEIDMNFIVPHFKFPIYKKVLKNNTFENIFNDDWLKEYNNYICDEKCGCSKNTNNNLCLIENKKSNIKIQCPKLCKTCNKCHNSYPNFEINPINNNLCENVKTKELKDKCLIYKNRIIKQKTLCNLLPNNKINFNNFKKNTIINSTYFKNKCNLFMIKNNLKFLYKQDILIHLKLTYNNLNDKLFKNIKITSCKFDLIEKPFNIFYIDKNNIYIIIEPTIKDINNCILFRLEGTIILNSIKNKKFIIKRNINIYKKQVNNINQDYYKEFLKSRKNLNIYDKGIISSFDNDYQNNYLDQNLSISNCQLNKDYFIFNPNLDIEQEEFKKITLMDNPDTWRERIDINRPWIFSS